MTVAEMIGRAQGGAAVENIAASIGARPEQVEQALTVILPQLTRTLERNTLSRGGLADLVQAVGDGHHEAYLQNPELLGSDAMRSDGEAILAHVLGSEEAGRSLAYRAAATTGLSEAIIAKLLPIIAAMLMGGLAKASKGALGDVLSKIPGLGGSAPAGGAAPPRPAARPVSRRPDTAPAGGGIGAGDSPLPIPGDTIPGIGRGENPYGDLSDVIRKGGNSVPGGGSVGGIVRDILGGLLGFQSKGIVGWIIRLVVMRWGWGIVQSILRRMLMGR